MSNESQKLKNEVLERLLQYKEAQVHALEFQKQVRRPTSKRLPGSRTWRLRVGARRVCAVHDWHLGLQQRQPELQPFFPIPHGFATCCAHSLRCMQERCILGCCPAALIAQPPPLLPSFPQMDPPPRFTVSADMVDMMRREGIAGLFTPEVLLRQVGGAPGDGARSGPGVMCLSTEFVLGRRVATALAADEAAAPVPCRSALWVPFFGTASPPPAAATTLNS